VNRNVWRSLVAFVVSASLLFGAFVIGEHNRSPNSRENPNNSRVRLATLMRVDATKLTIACNRVSTNASLNLSTPTIESRQGADRALLFATPSHYSLCLENSSGVSLSHPVEITRRHSPIYELESLGDLNKNNDSPLYQTDEWFVVRVNSSVAKLKVVTFGRSEVTAIHHGFVLVHETEVVDPGVKGFSYGVVVGFGANGELVGSSRLT
jgi:hypothetical protein